MKLVPLERQGMEAIPAGFVFLPTKIGILEGSRTFERKKGFSLVECSTIGPMGFLIVMGNIAYPRYLDYGTT